MEQKPKKKIKVRIGDLLNHRFVKDVLKETKPDVIIHYAEQPSAHIQCQIEKERYLLNITML